MVSHPKIFSEEIEEGKYKFTAVLLKMENAALAFFNEKGQMRLGTLAVAMPHFGIEKPCISSILLGERNMLITQILAERLAAAFNGLVLVSTYMRDVKEGEVGSVVLKLAQKLIEKIKEEK